MTPHLALTLGDPAGIGPEVALRALAHWPAPDCRVMLVGDRQLWQSSYQHLRAAGVRELANPEDWPLRDVPVENHAQIHLGQGNAASGAASFVALQTAIAGAVAGEFHAIVTAPIAKSLWRAAGHDYPGQTEVLATAAGVSRYGMLFVARSPHSGWRLVTLLATTHIPLRQVPAALNPDLLTTKLELLLASLRQDFGITAPTVAIAGLNPHSGEAGQLGTEERDWLQPWLTQQRQRDPAAKLLGPVPPDTLWVAPGRAWYGEPGPPVADAYLALYHDQGLIPVKMLAFDQAINTTIGLPFVRTSPDHGTAFDIAGQGLARAESMVAALQLATELVRQRSPD
ncbi:MAG: 4-hydroxythreonine-4-phosphate dehydrogenase PdxA [Spirulinaceae cyanobacterium RM2_2_10]|nr:4-hydroxythreonine-4-phosphate dehydrogenase PdxA [Spirulinaceae cyanobacterium SM2_1_0]NJO19932.1 4-hydroxythreonine-4-phosphate dehydrogenase PdxA [Spirulinaceae cyanobacterium RM2_2_10]